jgi:hypothetical protein
MPVKIQEFIIKFNAQASHNIEKRPLGVNGNEVDFLNNELLNGANMVSLIKEIIENTQER